MKTKKAVALILSIFVLCFNVSSVVAKEKAKKKELETYVLEGKLVKKDIRYYLEDDQKKLKKLPPLKIKKDKAGKPILLADYADKKVKVTVKGYVMKGMKNKKVVEKQILRHLIGIELIEKKKEEVKQEDE